MAVVSDLDDDFEPADECDGADYDGEHDYLDEPHDDECYDEDTGELRCFICKCGSHHCAGYCDDYQTYNLRPAETGGSDA